VEKVTQNQHAEPPHYKYYKYYTNHKFIGKRNGSIRFQLSTIEILKCSIFSGDEFFTPHF
jgi:hypothetical protein